MSAPSPNEDRERIRLLEYQAAFLRREVETLTRRYNEIAYSAAWTLATPLKRFEDFLHGLVHRAKGSAAAPRAPILPAPKMSDSIAIAKAMPDGIEARRLLVDVTAIVASDRRTGIQRVVRNILRALYRMERTGITPLAVRLQDGALVTCNAFVRNLLGAQAANDDMPVMPGSGDCLLMLDNSWDIYPQFAPVFSAVHAAGGTVVTCVYDLIPALYPAASVEPVPRVFDTWLRAAMIESDGIITISRAVMDDLSRYTEAQTLVHRPGLHVGWFHCGSDLDADFLRTPTRARPKLQRFLDGTAPVFLVVGTIEPRKGQSVALDAFEQLWAEGSNAKLLLIGSTGWHVAGLIERLRTHPERGSRLLWLDDAGDAELALAYRHCAALINPSYAEGFGLPLSEAARVGKPVLCSDIPVFREIGGEGALYFRVNDLAALAQCVRGFTDGTLHANPAAILQTTWSQAAQRIVDVVLDGGWSMTLGPAR